LLFTKSPERVDWLKIEAQVKDISAASSLVIPVAPFASLANDPPVIAPGKGVVSLSSHPDIIAKFQAAIAVSDSSNRQAAR
jgi:hypothetical protein